MTWHWVSRDSLVRHRGSIYKCEECRAKHRELVRIVRDQAAEDRDLR